MINHTKELLSNEVLKALAIAIQMTYCSKTLNQKEKKEVEEVEVA